MEKIMQELAASVIDSCAEAVENIPASRSLYENAETAKAVIDFKQRAIQAVLQAKPAWKR